MNEDKIRELLEHIRKDKVSVDDAIDKLKHLPFEDIGMACIDHHRGLRRGVSEVIFGEGKEPEDIIAIMEKMIEHGEKVMVTRLSQEKSDEILKAYPESEYYRKARILIHGSNPKEVSGKGTIVVVCAGTSDIPVAEEASVTARFMGNEVETIHDIGVAGLHRLLGNRDRIQKASVIIVVAGMEGALPSVVGGLVDVPVIAVPTSVGYGASFGGISALLGMLNSCAAGITVVNIDNGFGAGYAASVINRI